MKREARVALGVAGGYFPGRTKKMNFALALVGVAAGRRVGDPVSSSRRARSCWGSREVARLNDELRGRLLDRGRAPLW